MADNAVADGAQTVAPPTAGAGEGQSAGGSILAELEAPEPKADAGSSPDPWGDAEFLKRLESLDFSKAPEALRRKVEAPFVKDYTQKWQAVAEERKQLQSERERIFNVALDRLKEGPLASALRVFMVGVWPALALVAGVFVWMARRK